MFNKKFDFSKSESHKASFIKYKYELIYVTFTIINKNQIGYAETLHYWNIEKIICWIKYENISNQL